MTILFLFWEDAVTIRIWIIDHSLFIIVRSLVFEADSVSCGEELIVTLESRQAQVFWGKPNLLTNVCNCTILVCHLLVIHCQSRIERSGSCYSWRLLCWKHKGNEWHTAKKTLRLYSLGAKWSVIGYKENQAKAETWMIPLDNCTSLGITHEHGWD